MSVKSLDELIINRKELLEVHKKNNFTDGINSLLTDLYPGIVNISSVRNTRKL